MKVVGEMYTKCDVDYNYYITEANKLIIKGK